MQTVAESKFFAKCGGVGFGREEGIGSAFDDEDAIIKGDTICSDFPPQRFDDSKRVICASGFFFVA